VRDQLGVEGRRAWGMIDVNLAKVGVDDPVRRRKEQRPFESWGDLEALAIAIGGAVWADDPRLRPDRLSGSSK